MHRKSLVRAGYSFKGCPFGQLATDGNEIGEEEKEEEPEIEDENDELWAALGVSVFAASFLTVSIPTSMPSLSSLPVVILGLPFSLLPKPPNNISIALIAACCCCSLVFSSLSIGLVPFSSSTRSLFFSSSKR